ncbi:MAG TPA: hypothetical protein PK358_01875 [Spirochaetota bacterium]|nr:hypothetical protein [Spirochaetota bacterium]HPJ33552.1 hypothetical protein [Spirochaetota bacterium]
MSRLVIPRSLSPLILALFIILLLFSACETVEDSEEGSTAKWGEAVWGKDKWGE